MEIDRFGTLSDGTTVYQFTLQNTGGMRVRILNYGCIITELWVPNRNGRITDVVQGYDRLDFYEKDFTLCGAVVGRHANRISNGKFAVNGQEYQLTCNFQGHHIHGGQTGFQKQVFSHVPDENPRKLTLERLSPHGEEGYPGNLAVKISYELTEDNQFILRYEAQGDQVTPVSLTNHSYFNLSGDLSSSILSHHLWLAAQNYVENDPHNLPSALHVVEGTPFDFTKLAPIGSKLSLSHPQIRQSGGYDHYYPTPAAHKKNPCAMLYSAKSGISLTVFSNQPGLQLYSSNTGFDLPGKEGKQYQKHTALCLESQYIPNSMNLPDFPSALLPAGIPYVHETVWKFDAKDINL